VRRVAGLRAAPAVQARIDRLAEAANKATLSEDERAEYEALISAAEFMSILKVKARQHLERLARDERDAEIINRNARRLNREAMDTLGYQSHLVFGLLCPAGSVEGPTDLSSRKGSSRK
jgi:hypothetical protein